MSQKYLEVQHLFKIALNQQIQSKKLSVYDGLSLLWIFGQVKNESDFYELVEIYKGEFAFLNTLLIKEQQNTKETSNQDIQLLLTSYLKSDPKNGLKASEFVSNNPHVTVAELTEKFPDIKLLTA